MTGIPITEYESDPTVTTNVKPKFYNFSINSDKFCKAFDYKFTQTPESIIAEINANSTSIFTNRNNIKIYV